MPYNGPVPSGPGPQASSAPPPAKWTPGLMSMANVQPSGIVYKAYEPVAKPGGLGWLGWLLWVFGR